MGVAMSGSGDSGGGSAAATVAAAALADSAVNPGHGTVANSAMAMGVIPTDYTEKKHPYYLTPDNINAISGAAAGLVAGVVVCPLDVAKTKLQAQGGFTSLARQRPNSGPLKVAYEGMWGTLSQIYREEKFRGLYRGLSPIIIGYVPTWMIYFALYDKTKRFLYNSDGFNFLHMHPASIHILSAVTAGACSTTFTNPIWVVKTRLMSQNSQSSWKTYSGTWDALSSMIKQEGLGALYSGLGPALLGLTHVAIQFPLYEQFKKLLAPHTNDRSPQRLTFGIILASATSKAIASVATYPHEVLRTRNQIAVNNQKYRGLFRTMKTIYVEEGIAGFYAGLGTTLFRAIPSSVVTICTYEAISRYLSSL